MIYGSKDVPFLTENSIEILNEMGVLGRDEREIEKITRMNFQSRPHLLKNKRD
jgi:hypothetical protein